MGNFGRDNRGGRDFGRNRGGFGGGRGRDFGGSRGGFGGNRGGDREMFSAVCSNCGKECQIPFKPTSGKPVYCSECFEKMGGGRDSRRPGRSDFRPQSSGSDQNKVQFDAINAKLDKILSILAPTPVVKEEKIVDPIKEDAELKEVEPKKAKKTVKKSAVKKE